MLTRHSFKRLLFTIACALALLVVSTAKVGVRAEQSQTDLTGKYNVTGTDPDGKTYTGTLDISTSTATLSGATVYQLKWTFGSQTDVGLGALYGNMLGVTFGTSDCVLSIYGLGDQSKDNSITGVWSNITTQNFGTEKVTFDKSTASDHLAADYKIAGTNPDNSTYTGTLNIEGYGLLYDLTWVVGSDTTNGTGLLLPNPTAIIAASGAKAGEKCSAAFYQVVDGDLYGTWVSVGDKVTGTELAIKSS